MASKSVSQAVAKGSSAVVKKVVNKGLKLAGTTATDILAETAEKVVSNKAKAKEDLAMTSLSNIEKLVTTIARQPTGQLTPI